LKKQTKGNWERQVNFGRIDAPAPSGHQAVRCGNDDHLSIEIDFFWLYIHKWYVNTAARADFKIMNSDPNLFMTTLFLNKMMVKQH